MLALATAQENELRCVVFGTGNLATQNWSLAPEPATLGSGRTKCEKLLALGENCECWIKRKERRLSKEVCTFVFEGLSAISSKSFCCFVLCCLFLYRLFVWWRECYQTASSSLKAWTSRKRCSSVQRNNCKKLKKIYYKNRHIGEREEYWEKE